MPTADPRRSLPQVDHLLTLLRDQIDLPRPVLAEAIRRALGDLRSGGQIADADVVLERVRAEAMRYRGRLLRPVINATGVVLHTNLGRAPLSRQAAEAAVRAGSEYSNLELDLQTGRRGDRYEHVEPLIALLTGAASCLVVNNNAAAVLLVCAALAAGREVVVSRGELIEIGGQFRIPEVLQTSGAALREVGTTNRTHLSDYQAAIGPGTAMVMKVHPSNYRIVGFATTPPVRELAGLCAEHAIPLVYDAGSGLVGTPAFDEPTIGHALSAGADLVCFSGDKLFGGPQAGIVAGRSDLIATLRRHPLVRALRPDKMCLAALQETALQYLGDDRSGLPVWRMLDTTADELTQRCERLCSRIREAVSCHVVQETSVAGGGSLPGVDIPGPAVAITHPALNAEDLAAALRGSDPPVIARIADSRVVLDLRTVPLDADESLAAAVLAAGAGAHGVAPEPSEA